MKKSLISTLIVFATVHGNALAEVDAATLACQKAVDGRDFSAAAASRDQQRSFEGLMCAGRAALVLGEYANAEASFQKAEGLADSKFSAMAASTFSARAKRGAGQLEDALTAYQRSLALARETKSWQGQWANLNEIGQIFHEQKNFPAALKSFKDGYTFAANDNERSECNQLMAETYAAMADFDHAIEFQLKSTILEERSGDPNAYLGARLKLAEYAAEAKDYARAENELNALLKISVEAESIFWQARAMLGLTKLSKQQARMDQFKERFKAASDLANKSGIAVLIEEVGKLAP